MATPAYLLSLHNHLRPHLNEITRGLFPGTEWSVESVREVPELHLQIDSDHWAILRNRDGSVAAVPANKFEILSNVMSPYILTCEYDGKDASTNFNFLTRLAISKDETIVTGPLISRPYLDGFTKKPAGQKITKAQAMMQGMKAALAAV